MTDLSENHRTLENYKQHMTTKDWKLILLSGRDSLMINGHIRILKARNLGAGVVEIYKK